jgi:hypothetical protein
MVKHMGFKYCRFFLVVLSPLLPVITSVSLFAGDVTLVWDANTETDLAGYKVYYGTVSRTYGTPIVIGTQTTYTVTGLAPGTYYFAVTAYNTSSLESGFSNEVTATIVQLSRCDINADQGVNALDIQRLINVILGSTCPGNCDINGDGSVNVLDLQILGNVILGVRSCP